MQDTPKLPHVSQPFGTGSCAYCSMPAAELALAKNVYADCPERVKIADYYREINVEQENAGICKPVEPPPADDMISRALKQRDPWDVPRTRRSS